LLGLLVERLAEERLEAASLAGKDACRQVEGRLPSLPVTAASLPPDQ
jgi:hypothetical protein